MAAVRPGGRAREVVVQARVDRAGNVGGAVLVASPVFVLQIEPAVNDGPVVEMRGEQIGRDERRVHVNKGRPEGRPLPYGEKGLFEADLEVGLLS